MNFTLHQLHVFLKVTERRSITKAAEDLHLSQPAVSIQLRNFQEQFDIPLTEVVGRQLYITDFGKEIAATAETILEQVGTINQRIAMHKGLLTGKLRLSVVSTGNYVMPYFLTEFLRLHPSIELKMDVTNKTRVLESLVQNEVDFSLVSIMPEKIEVEDVTLLENRLYLVGSASSPFDGSAFPVEELAHLPFIFREKGSGTRQLMEDFFDKHQLGVRLKFELTNNESVKQAVKAGLGYSIMPLIGIRNEIQNNQLRILPTQDLPIITQWRLIWLKGKKLSPVAAAFITFIKANRAEIAARAFGEGDLTQNDMANE